jgi:putative ABC transport system ATP-binding protein
MNSVQEHSAHGEDNVGQPPQVMLAADGIRRTFGSGHTAVHALRGVSFTVDRGQLVALRGRSGSGKTTLLNIIGGLDDPRAGRVWVDGREVNRMSERERLALRRDRIAFIFQSFGLVPMLSAAENVGIPLRIAGVAPSERRERVAAMLALTGVASHAAHMPRTARMSFPAASSSEWPSPARWLAGRAC